jgi:glucose-6-phosphate isomerase
MSELLRIDFTYADAARSASLASAAEAARDTLVGRKGPGADFLGWLDLPAKNTTTQLNGIEAAARQIRSAEALVVVGIGGSYLGARAVIEALMPPFGAGFPIYYAGHQMDARYHAGLLEHLAGKRYAVNVISKSGTTTEPGVAFRLLWKELSARYDAAALKQLVFATTDGKKGSLRSLATRAGLETFVIPDDVGGRFSVLSPVGLLPIAAAGVDIRALVEGAHQMAAYLEGPGKAFDKNPALQYAAFRNAQYQNGKKIEVLASYQAGLASFHEWWKQLYGESEGKNGKGIFPASVSLSTDLHSMGQWMQDGERIIFETVLDVENVAGPTLFSQDNDDDGLNYLAGKTLNAVNRIALEATLAAHRDGGVESARILIPDLSPNSLGALIYMFEYACGVSAYMLGVNPFDQPGVEAYKSNMFKMLGKSGH